MSCTLSSPAVSQNSIMNNYKDWYKNSLDDLRKDCSQRGVSNPISKWDAIEKLLASDRNMMEQRKDRRDYDNLTDPLGEKRFAQAQAERDWILHVTKCIGNIEIETSSNLARSCSPVHEFFEAEARKRDAALQERLTSIYDSFKAKTDAIIREAHQVTEEQFMRSVANENVLADKGSDRRMKMGGMCGIEVSTSVVNSSLNFARSKLIIDQGNSQRPTRKEHSKCLNKGDPITAEDVTSINASKAHFGKKKGPITPPLQRPFIFLHRKYLQSGDQQLDDLRRDIKTKTKKFSEEQGLAGASFAGPLIIKSHTSGFYIGYTHSIDVEKLHEVLKGQPLFGKEVQFRLELDFKPKVCRSAWLQVDC